MMFCLLVVMWPGGLLGLLRILVNLGEVALPVLLLLPKLPGLSLLLLGLSRLRGGGRRRGE